MPCYDWCNTRNTKEKIYNKLCLYSISKRRWHGKLIFLHKILNGFLPEITLFASDIPLSRELPFEISINYQSKLNPFKSKPL